MIATVKSKSTRLFKERTYRDDSIALIWIYATGTSEPIAHFPRADYNHEPPTDEATMEQLANLFAFAYDQGRKDGYDQKSNELKKLLNL